MPARSRLPAFWILFWALAFMVLQVQASVSQDKCPSQCPRCPSVSHCTRTLTDICGCCPVCVRASGESCGPSVGVCESRLQCVQHSQEEVGVCKAMAPSSACLKANCSVILHPECPSDSRLLVVPPAKGECCEQPGKCICDLQNCVKSVPSCSDGLERVLVEDAGSEPGSCCQKFECRPKESHCENVRCPPVVHNSEEDECPEDSVRPPTHVTPGTCCPVSPRCKCRGSVCRPASCPDGSKVKVLRKGNGSPGNCCDLWECENGDTTLAKKCTWGGAVYSDGEEWHSSSCEVCRCKKGVAQCSKMTCPKPPSECTWIGVPTGECCPVCLGCQTEKLEKKKKNDTWHRDDCTTCTCSEEGANVCEKAMCSVSCENPRKVAGQCCPVCDEPTLITLPSTCPSIEHCPLRCENGLKRDKLGCFVCECLAPSRPSSDNTCPQLSKANCDKQCAHGYLRDEAGCVSCRCAKCPPLHQCIKHCLYGFETNAAGCPVCKCRARIDAKLSISDRLDSLSGKDRCGSLSQSGRLFERDGGEWWNDGCRHCFCEHRQEFCSLISCAERAESCAEEHWVQQPGQCCPSCVGGSSSMSPSAQHEHTVCQSPGSGRLYTDGETWQLAPCVWCTCRVGQVLCRTESCPPVACPHPVQDPQNHCCSICKAEDLPKSDPNVVCTDDLGVAHASGHAWRTDDCTSCTCSDGTIECFRESCDETVKCSGKPLIIKGRCCPVCSDVLHSSSLCMYTNTAYALHEEWKDGACRNCTCAHGGQTVCRETLCPPCADPVPIQGQCCPLCKDSGGWGAFGSGDMALADPGEQSGSNWGLAALSLCTLSLFVVLFIVLFILYRRRNAVKQPKSAPLQVQLSSCKQHGSMPHLPDFERGGYSGADDGQSESLLSTTAQARSGTIKSESSAGMSQSSATSDTHLLYKTAKYRV